MVSIEWAGPDVGQDRARQRPYLAFGKRLFDIALALILLPILLPAIAVLWLLVRRDGGPGFFAHRRIGRNGEEFNCWKLRSMVPDSAAVLQAHLAADPQAQAEWQATFKLRCDPRVTKLGQFIRRTSLDELPQIFNVLKGEMSFVGPRPIIADEKPLYGRHFDRCFSVRPGITGYWQTSGRNATSYRKRVQLDLVYARHASFGLDLVIILRTAREIFRRSGM